MFGNGKQKHCFTYHTVNVRFLDSRLPEMLENLTSIALIFEQ